MASLGRQPLLLQKIEQTDHKTEIVKAIEVVPLY